MALSALFCLASLLCSAPSTCAQSLSGVRVGDDLSNAIRQIGIPPSKIDRSGPFTYSMWTLDDGNELHVTTRDGEDKILYMESDWGGWNGDRGSPETDFSNIFFGRTTRSEIISKMGSKGLLYKARFLPAESPDKSLEFDAIYGIARTDIVVDFLTRINDTALHLLAKSGKVYFTTHVFRDPQIVGIIVAKQDYLNNLWGEHAASKDYRPVALEVLQPQIKPVDIAKRKDSVLLSFRDGVSLVPVKINDRLILDFVVDSGAADVQIPDDVFRTLLRTGTISQEDFLGTSIYIQADGTKIPSERYLIQKMAVGEHVVRNVVASIGDPQSQLLLGESFLSKFRSWMLDNSKHVLILMDK
ncbi:MAG: retropepsin-like aspartic protease [Stellaceae bacterium]